jgi:hypothetical protein
MGGISMSFNGFRIACCGLVASAAAIGLQSSARAGTVTLADNYYGGTNYYNSCPGCSPPTGDVIGEAGVFNITSAALTLNTNANTLSVTINTYFAGAPTSSNPTVANDVAGTAYGSLFLGSASTWQTDHPAANAPWATDVYHPAEWSYAFVTGGTPATTGAYSVGTVGSGVLNPGNNPANVVKYYNTNNGGQVVMSNVNNDPISYPNGGNPNYWFRQGQAVQFTPGRTATPTVNGTFSVSPTTYVGVTDTALTEGSITYTIDNYSSLNLGNDIAISWAMTCGNDIIQGTVNLGGNGQTPEPTPLPAALPLFAAGLGVLGFAGSRRRKSAAKAKVAL